ncbi:uncharacterized protein [Mycetomoellerius zeteki]|uniref:uncharacterized protein n=1 Tax=Mycetomoellerius zeteki TaxID=64791 RepID=UPI00084E443A|nr:PREDICTED: uncharacterized protein LOC108730646 [Trachymyrmex zeteki]
MDYELVAETRQTVETASAPTAGLQLEAAMVGSAHNKDGDIVSRSSASDLTLVCFGSLPTGHGAGCWTHAARICRSWPRVDGDDRATSLVRCIEGWRRSSNLAREPPPAGLVFRNCCGAREIRRRDRASVYS